MKNKILYIFVLILFATILFVGSVNAAEYADKDKSIIITMDDLGIGGTQKVETKWGESGYKNKYEENEYSNIDNNITIENVNQTKLNEYAKDPKKYNANIKLKIPNDTKKVEYTKRFYDALNDKYIYDYKEIKIETINGSKYASYDCELHYYSFSEMKKPIDSNIASIALYDSRWIYEVDSFMKIYNTSGNYAKYGVHTQINIISENKPFNYSFGYENQYGQVYPIIGGAGGAQDDDKWYLTTEAHINGGYGSGPLYGLPTDVKLSEAYCVLYIDVYQGEKIEVEGMGTLNYVGVSKVDNWNTEGIYYVYKNSLDKLNKITKPAIFKAKTESGYTLTRGIYFWWQLYEGTKEDQIKVENTDIILNKIYKEYDYLKPGTIKARKTDTIYKKLENGYDDLKDTNYDTISIDINDICIANGTYSGNINIEFNVGTENNGKEYVVSFSKEVKDKLEFHVYNGIVKNGKIIITIDSSILPRKDDRMIKIGDINKDGKINTKDAREVLLAYIGKNKLTDVQRIAADVNKDGKINTKDARQILLYYIGKIKNFTN